jgi:hypothetical protein
LNSKVIRYRVLGSPQANEFGDPRAEVAWLTLHATYVHRLVLDVVTAAQLRALAAGSDRIVERIQAERSKISA